MKKHIKKPEVVQLNSKALDLSHRPVTRAGLHLAQRYRVDPAIADLIAGFAGLGVGSEAPTVAITKPEERNN